MMTADKQSQTEPFDIAKSFTKAEAVMLTESTADRLVYLDKLGLIIPHRIGSKKRPLLFYTWNQLMQIKAYDILKEAGKKDGYIVHVLLEIAKRYNDLEFLNYKFIFYNDAVYWYDRKEKEERVYAEIKKHYMETHPSPEVMIYSSAPVPVNYEVQPMQIEWAHYQSITYFVKLLIKTAYNSRKYINFEEFKQKIDYEFLKDSLELE